MSWGEVGKINNNYKRALNEQMRDLKFQELHIITSTGTYTPPKTGLYKVICVGAGGKGAASGVSGSVGGTGGGGGGVAIKTLKLSVGSSYSVTVGTTASFVYDTDTILTATAGGDASGSSKVGTGGTASGGDTNYIGGAGLKTDSSYVVAEGGTVGVFLSGLYTKPVEIAPLAVAYGDTSQAVNFPFGGCILNYGGGGAGAGCRYKTNNEGDTWSEIRSMPGKPAAIIIAPLEMEE